MVLILYTNYVTSIGTKLLKNKKIDDDKTKLNKDHIPTNLHNISRSKLKQLITDYFLDSY